MKYNTRFSAKRIEATDLDPVAMARELQTPTNQTGTLTCPYSVNGRSAHIYINQD